MLSICRFGALCVVLDLSGDRAEIPSGIVQGQPPTNNDFYFSDLLYDPQG